MASFSSVSVRDRVCRRRAGPQIGGRRVCPHTRGTARQCLVIWASCCLRIDRCILRGQATSYCLTADYPNVCQGPPSLGSTDPGCLARLHAPETSPVVPVYAAGARTLHASRLLLDIHAGGHLGDGCHWSDTSFATMRCTWRTMAVTYATLHRSTSFDRPTVPCIGAEDLSSLGVPPVRVDKREVGVH